MEQQATTQKSLERQMQIAVAEQKYEEAARLRDAIKTLQADKEVEADKKKAEQTKKKDERAIAMVEQKVKQAAAKMEFEDAAKLRDAVNVLTKGSTKGSQKLAVPERPERPRPGQDAVAGAVGKGEAKKKEEQPVSQRKDQAKKKVEERKQAEEGARKKKEQVKKKKQQQPQKKSSALQLAAVNQSLSLLQWALKEARQRRTIIAAVVVIAVFVAHAPRTPANQHSTLQTQHVRANASNFKQQLHALQHQATQLHALHNQVAVNYSGYTGAGPMTLEQQQSCVAAQAMASRTDQMAADITECVAMLLIVPSGDSVGCTIAAMRRHQTNTALVSFALVSL
jgi:excinuclease UvrABC nuclease subunit